MWYTPILTVLHSEEQLSESLKVISADGRKALREFIRLPWSLYADDPAWVPPLLLERSQFISPRNPYFAHAKCCLWLAYRDKKPVGRIIAQIDELHLARYRDATGFFGMLEAEDNCETFHALLDTAETWLRDEGIKRVRGPFNLSINQECGLLIEGFEIPPMFMMSHARPYYPLRVEEQGYEYAKDLFAYQVEANFTFTKSVQAVLEKARRHVHVRPLRRAHFDEDFKIIQEIWKEAWSENWGFLPLTKAELSHFGYALRFLANKDFVQIAEVDGVPAAMIVALPNLNELIRDLDGRIFPFGWLKLVWRLKVGFSKTARVLLMGIRKQYNETRLGAALAFMLVDALRGAGLRRGIRQWELSWILEDNKGMRHILESIGAFPYKHYRIYQKDLT